MATLRGSALGQVDQMPRPHDPMMYTIEPIASDQVNIYVNHLELEFEDDARVFTDVAQLIARLLELNIRWVYIIGDDKQWNEVVKSALSKFLFVED